jgi:hypothetical protein
VCGVQVKVRVGVSPSPGSIAAISKGKRFRYEATYLNKHSMSFMPAIACGTATRIHDELSCPLFLH